MIDFFNEFFKNNGIILLEFFFKNFNKFKIKIRIIN